MAPPPRDYPDISEPIQGRVNRMILQVIVAGWGALEQGALEAPDKVILCDTSYWGIFPIIYLAHLVTKSWVGGNLNAVLQKRILL